MFEFEFEYYGSAFLVIFRARFDEGAMQVPVSIFSTGSFFPTFPLSLQTRLIPL